MEALERREIMVDEFKSSGETNLNALSRKGEEIFHQYNQNLKENEASCAFCDKCYKH